MCQKDEEHTKNKRAYQKLKFLYPSFTECEKLMQYVF